MINKTEFEKAWFKMILNSEYKIDIQSNFILFDKNISDRITDAGRNNIKYIKEQCDEFLNSDK